MPQTVLITGTGRPYALGFNLVKRYLENGDCVFASIRRPSEALEELKKEYPDRLHILTMDISSTESVEQAARDAEKLVSSLDLIINNATTASADTMKELPDFDLDLIAPAVNVGAVGPIRVIKAFMPLLKKSPIGALVVNISSEAGSIGKCYRTFYLDYGNPVSAVLQLSLQWSGITTCSLDPEKMEAFFDGYLEAYDNGFRDYAGVLGLAYTWIEWLEYNITRALGKCRDESERETGISEVRNTISRIRYIREAEDRIRQQLIHLSEKN